MKIRLEVFCNPDCSRCERVWQQIHELSVEGLAGQIELRRLDITEEIDYAVALGVLQAPAIVIDGTLYSSGRASMKKLQSRLSEMLQEDSQ